MGFLKRAKTAKKAKKAMLIGLDGMILPFAERSVMEGKMPTFKKLMKEGCSGAAVGLATLKNQKPYSSTIGNLSGGGILSQYMSSTGTPKV